MINPFIIMKEVEKYFGIPKGSICKANRSKSRTEARAVAAKLCRVYTGFSFPEIGETFLKHHTSIMHAVVKVNNDPRLYNIFYKLSIILDKHLHNAER